MRLVRKGILRYEKEVCPIGYVCNASFSSFFLVAGQVPLNIGNQANMDPPKTAGKLESRESKDSLGSELAE
jgi:hypothetical protein